MTLDDFALPDDEEGAYLLDGMGRLIARAGAGPFLAAPLLLPEPRFFPDRVSENRAENVAVCSGGCSRMRKSTCVRCR